MESSKRGIFFSAGVLSGVFVSSALLTIPAVEGIPLCLFHFFTHLDCPGCGLARSFISLSHGQLLAAIRFNALGPVLYLIFFLLLLRLIFRGLGKTFPSPFVFGERWVYWLFAFLFWGQWVFKLARGIHQYYL